MIHRGLYPHYISSFRLECNGMEKSMKIKLNRSLRYGPDDDQKVGNETLHGLCPRRPLDF
jgi:hypothetical protein